MVPTHALATHAAQSKFPTHAKSCNSTISCNSDLTLQFDAEPVASGSIGQIHRAVLSDTGARLTGMQPGELQGPGGALMCGDAAW